MAPQPKRKHSSMRQGKRRASISLSLPTLVTCPHCQTLHLSHQMCPKCGFYHDREVLKPKIPKEKKKT